jgi:hypothetical protein
MYRSYVEGGKVSGGTGSCTAPAFDASFDGWDSFFKSLQPVMKVVFHLNSTGLHDGESKIIHCAGI